MSLLPWYKVITPREDLRENRPLDAAEFAVHLDQVRDDRGPTVYRNPEEFFARTFLTKNLLKLAGESVRRLNGEITETSAVFNMATQFGGGKTHALTLLYHLARHGNTAKQWPGVDRILSEGRVSAIPECATAVFVGTELDPIAGRGGDGEPLRKTPWGEIAFQLGGAKAFELVAKHDAECIPPGGDVIRKILPENGPCLILMDELMNYISRGRKAGMPTQLYNFLQNLSETARGRDNVVLVVSVPASHLEITQSHEDQEDFTRYRKLLDRLGKPIMMSAEAEAAEIIRRRLFEWEAEGVGANGKVNLPGKALDACKAYADWVIGHRQQIPGWFPTDHALEEFKTTYPFHPMAISVFERKWQTLPRFQRTRGVLRMLALWVANAYQEGYKGAQQDPLIGLGTAPLDDPAFRQVIIEQIDEDRLEAAITTDITGRQDSLAVRLDHDAVDAIKKSRLHRKVATIILFESNGGTTKEDATVPEIRLALAEPNLDIGNVDTVLEALESTCYYLAIHRNRYRFTFTPNLNKMLADRRANIDSGKILERMRAEVQKVFSKKDPNVPGEVERRFFPEKSNEIPNRPILTLAVLSPEVSLSDRKDTLALIEKMTRECGASARTFKNAIVWCVADSPAILEDEARKLLAWEEIEDSDSDGLSETQQHQLEQHLAKARQDFTETVWRTYRHLVLLDKNNQLRVADMGLVNSSMGTSLTAVILQQLKKDGEVESAISPAFVMRNWPPAFTEWSTKAIRDAFFSSPVFPRLLNGDDAVKDMVARGVRGGILAYAGKSADGRYEPFHFQEELDPFYVEISEEMYVVPQKVAEAYAAGHQPSVVQPGPQPRAVTGTGEGSEGTGTGQGELPGTGKEGGPIKCVHWHGVVPPQKWMNFYTKVLSSYARSKGLTLTLDVEVAPEHGLAPHHLEEMRSALRELGIEGDLRKE